MFLLYYIILDAYVTYTYSGIFMFSINLFLKNIEYRIGQILKLIFFIKNELIFN